jgi:single-strand DNA-binding protein
VASSFNKIVIVGYVGGNPDSRYLPSGDAVTSFRVATTEKWKGRDGIQQERTTWFSCSAFGRLAEQCSQLLKNGTYVYLDGRLSTREYTDRQGAERTSLDVRASEMRLLDRLAEPATGGAYAAADAGAHLPLGVEDPRILDEVPF